MKPGFQSFATLLVAAGMTLARGASAEPPTEAPPTGEPVEGSPTESAVSSGGDDSQQRDAAQELFWRATEQYRTGNYQRAVELFEAAYALAPQGEITFNIAAAYAKGGRCELAQSRFLEYTSQSSDADAVRKAEERFRPLIAQCERAAAKTANAAGEPAPPVVPMPPQPATPPERAGTEHADAAPKHGSRDESPKSDDRVLAWSAFGAATVIAAGLAGYFQLRRVEIAEDARGAESEHRYNELKQDFRRAGLYQVAALIGMGAGALGLGLLAVDSSRSSAPRDAVSARRPVFVSVSGQF